MGDELRTAPPCREFRLLSAQRMRLKADFDRPRAEGRTFHHPAFLLRAFAPRAGQRLPRLGVIASRRVGRAHERNRAKRLLRETFRLEQSSLPGPLDILLIARKPILGSTLAELREDFRGFARRLRCCDSPNTTARPSGPSARKPFS